MNKNLFNKKYIKYQNKIKKIQLGGDKINILVGCHCVSVHENINLIYKKTGEIIESNEIEKLKEKNINTISYIDINCSPDNTTQFNNWKDIPENSNNIIWLLHCPIYGFHQPYHDGKYKLNRKVLNHAIPILKEIYINAYRILRPNGYMLIQIPSFLSETTYKMILTILFNINKDGILPSDGVPFEKFNDKDKFENELFIFEPIRNDQLDFVIDTYDILDFIDEMINIKITKK